MRLIKNQQNNDFTVIDLNVGSTDSLAGCGEELDRKIIREIIEIFSLLLGYRPHYQRRPDPSIPKSMNGPILSKINGMLTWSELHNDYNAKFGREATGSSMPCREGASGCAW